MGKTRRGEQKSIMRFSVIGVIENISKNEFAPERITQTFQKEGNGFKERP
jgi:hypothetical protein